MRLDKPLLLLGYIKAYPETAPCSMLLSASLMRLYFFEEDIISAIWSTYRIGWWYVYDNRWAEQGEDRLGINQLLQTRFLDRAASIKGAVSSLNIFKNHMDGQMDERKEFILELGKSISNARRLSHILRGARPYFHRDGPMGSDHKLLQLSNATLDLMANTIRKIRLVDYLTKCSAVEVPDYVVGVATTSSRQRLAQ